MKELNFYIDGIVNGELQGWAESIEFIRLRNSRNLSIVAECDKYRDDLKGFLEDAESSFCYKLSTEQLVDLLLDPELEVEFYDKGELVFEYNMIFDHNNIIDSINQLPSNDCNVSIYNGDLFILTPCKSKGDVSVCIEGIQIDMISKVYSANGFDIYKACFDFDAILDDWFLKENIILEISDTDYSNSVSIPYERLLNNINIIRGVNVDEYLDVISSDYLWSESYYISQRSSLRLKLSTLENPILDYLLLGSRLGLEPSEYFDSNFYLEQNQDVRKFGMNPLFHYIKYGESEGRCPNAWFNPNIYREKNPEVDEWSRSKLSHYIIIGKNQKLVYSENISVNRSTEFESNRIDYAAWREENERYPYNYILNALKEIGVKIKISIILPTYNSNIKYLEQCIESVINQSYPNWELCIADDHSESVDLQRYLKEKSKSDGRIKYAVRKQNGHISECSNTGLSLSSGEWVCFLDHDDMLHEHALLFFAQKLNSNDKLQLIYTDEDKVSKTGFRYDPHFKSDWNEDLFYSQNYISHLSFFKSELVKEIGGLRKGVEGSQDYDLLLRYIEVIDKNNISHIPKVLYHWRAISGSTAYSIHEKKYTSEAGLKSLEMLFSSNDISVEYGKQPNTYRVKRILTKEPLVSIIIPARNHTEITRNAIESIIRLTSYVNYEIIIVDNKSDTIDFANYIREIESHPKIRVFKYPYEFNYSAINNFASEKARGEVLVFLNNDIEVISPEWLIELTSQALRDDIGCVGAKLYYGDNTIQHAGILCGINGVGTHSHLGAKRTDNGYFGRLNLLQNVSAVTGACLAIKKSLFVQLGGFNEKELAINFNDVDLCLKAKKAGYRNLWTPYAELYHFESKSRGYDDDKSKIARFDSEVRYMINQWGPELKVDPFYNPNLDQVTGDFSIVV
ncbi:TPA: glycosyltransferase family 2 protein [Vibrio parahaemolyticus]|uniref:glycosyltransferase family 2 protein n=1 Tax=Vibrio parahaemolyticus TaxID=670 RepID=UPI002269ACEF|nr:glycosyltransferase family 2 protein [Vibrio parahaemolyticus]MCX8925360.1 glycosyltransferase family 2 protein [Vibrio parahaemolyticus]HCG8183299.1 glycosyltransferase family 2 protein [Vibrio parahaemolyticus]